MSKASDQVRRWRSEHPGYEKAWRRAHPESGKAAGTAAPSAVTAPALPQQPETSAVNAPVRENTAFPVTLVILVIGGVLAAVGFGVLFIWLSCRFNFVLLDVLVTRAVSVRESFRRHQEIGNSYFGWSLAFLGIGLGAIAITGLLMGILIWLAKGHLALSVPAAIVGGLLIVALLLAMIVIGLVAHDFVSPIMYREKISTKEAWHKFFRAGTSKVRKVVQYILAVMGLTIVASIVQTVVSLVAMLAGLIAGGVLLIPGILLVIVIPSLKVPLIVLGAGLGLALIVIVLAVIGMAMLPASIFLRMFALTYVMRLCPDCDLLNFKGRP